MQTLLHSREVSKLKGNLRFNAFLYSKTEIYLVYNERMEEKPPLFMSEELKAENVFA